MADKLTQRIASCRSSQPLFFFFFLIFGVVERGGGRGGNVGCVFSLFRAYGDIDASVDEIEYMNTTTEMKGGESEGKKKEK